ncbi:MAG: diaminobutyrate--2-oxoglutarate transaminase family protein [Polyangiales bacterium]
MDSSAPTLSPLPTSDWFLARQAERESNARTYPRGLPLAISHARGCEVYSVEGRRYLDFFSGAGVLAVGHNHPKVVEAVRRQLELVVHTLDLPTPTRDQFVSDVLELLPPALRDRMRVHICAPTGSDAIEAALKLCKRATGREAVVAFQGSYHGMTSGALAATSCVELKEKLPGATSIAGVTFAPYSYCKRCPLKLDIGRCDTACAAMFETMLEDTHSGLPRPAAVLMELLQGEGGGIVPRPEFVARVAQAAKAHGVPLIADEIQAGLGRTGRWFAFEHFGIEPDVIALSKALGGIGLPIAAILYRKELDVWEPGTHIGTFRGHQLAMAAGSAAIAVLRSEGLVDNARERGLQLKAALESLTLRSIGEVRGLGLMIGVELIDPATGKPSGERARAVRAECFARGLLCELGGRADGTVRLLPPLCLTEHEAAEGAEILCQALRIVDSRFGS